MFTCTCKSGILAFDHTVWATQVDRTVNRQQVLNEFILCVMPFMRIRADKLKLDYKPLDGRVWFWFPEFTEYSSK